MLSSTFPNWTMRFLALLGLSVSPSHRRRQRNARPLRNNERGWTFYLHLNEFLTFILFIRYFPSSFRFALRVTEIVVSERNKKRRHTENTRERLKTVFSPSSRFSLAIGISQSARSTEYFSWCFVFDFLHLFWDNGWRVISSKSSSWMKRKVLYFYTLNCLLFVKNQCHKVWATWFSQCTCRSSNIS